ncbi:YmiA family putative membrane protein [Superficieibacter sp. BNK-5]
MSSGSDQPKREPELKRKAWRAVFVGSALFWVALVLLIWKFWG